MAFSFFKKKEGDSAKKESSRYLHLTVKEVIRETADAITIVFEKPATGLTYKAGQFLTLICDINGESVRRAYSLCTSPEVDEDLAVTVKRVEGGVMSNYLNDEIKAGDSIKVMPPLGNFTTVLRPENKRHIVMFGGGSGITPLMGLTKSLLYGEPETVVSLIYTNRNIDSVIFKDKLEALETQYEGRLQVIHVLDDAPVNWQGPSGLLNEEMLNKLFERIPDWGKDNTQYLMCGPEGMMHNVEELLHKLDIPKDHIYKESFVQSTIDKAEKGGKKENDGKAHSVTIILDGEEHNFEVPAGKAILETALDNDIDMPFSCQSGLCTACRGKLLSGTMTMEEEEGLSDAEREEGYVLTCVGHPTSDDVKIEIG